MENIFTKDYYTLKELIPIVRLKYRQLQKRMISISLKYKDNKTLLYKKSNKWNIHKSIVKIEFSRKRKPINYQLFATISSANNYDIKYWRYIIKEQINPIIKSLEPTSRIKYVIELNKQNLYHLHFITTFERKKDLKKILADNLLTSKENDMNTLIKYIWEVKGLHQYFRKQNKPVLLK